MVRLEKQYLSANTRIIVIQVGYLDKAITIYISVEYHLCQIIGPFS